MLLWVMCGSLGFQFASSSAVRLFCSFEILQPFIALCCKIRPAWSPFRSAMLRKCYKRNRYCSFSAQRLLSKGFTFHPPPRPWRRPRETPSFQEGMELCFVLGFRTSTLIKNSILSHRWQGSTSRLGLLPPVIWRSYTFIKQFCLVK